MPSVLSIYILSLTAMGWRGERNEKLVEGLFFTIVLIPNKKSLLPRMLQIIINNFVEGVKLREAGKLSEALERFDFIVQQGWRRYYELIAEAYFQVGEMELLGRNFEKAEVKLRKCVKFNFSHSLAFEYLHLLEVGKK